MIPLVLPSAVKIVEVGPRDGLQNESKHVSSADKISLIERLAAAGLSQIEMTAFVSPRQIPALADANEVAAGVCKLPGVEYSALVPNLQGYEAASKAGVTSCALFLSASETHCQKNINKSVAQALESFQAVSQRARADGNRLRAYISTVFGCPYEGEVPIAKTIDIARSLLALGVEEISLGDTTGMGTPLQVARYLAELFAELPPERFACHFHDTRGTALVNSLIALQSGVKIFDTSIGGLGGCPYAPGATGNLATDDLVYLLTSMGIETGVKLAELTAITSWICQEVLQIEIPSRYAKAKLAELTRKDLVTITP
ncbi:MAG: hydroxymethylglutaryl-CoA lyase [Cyanobacteria bacterium NC_groundwater_1444_Ag_S-0.65um_54_12]|nr:hydroxymethylglutaryl-CoA lyase [Cyanobacteria bacterium NC_groundwater_1444_Ag_S-0.65um_54_12]